MMSRERVTMKSLSALALLPALWLGACGSGSPTGPSDGGPAGGGNPATVTSITISGAQAVSEGATVQLSATAGLSDGSSRDVTSQAAWASSNAGTATISATGLVQGVKSGTVDISATYQGAQGRATVTVSAALFDVVVDLRSFVPLDTCDDFTQGLDQTEVSFQAVATLADGRQDVLGGIIGYPGNPSGSQLLGAVQLGRGQVHVLSGNRETFTLPGEPGQSVRVELRVTEWDQEIVVIPPSVRWIRDSRMDDARGSLSHSYAQGSWSNLGARSITLGSGECRMQLNYEVTATRR